MLVTKPYNRERAVEYALRWALDRNPLFIDFTGIGGNCTNFVSQAILAGSCTMNYTPNYGWYYVDANDRAPAWSGVEFFYDFMTGAPVFSQQNGGVGPFAVEIPMEQAEPGDVIQYANREGDWYHTVMVTGRDADGELLVSAQSDDARNRRLSTYNFASARFLRIAGVRVEINDDVCFDVLLNGGEPPPMPPITEAPSMEAPRGEEVPPSTQE